jgi:cytochrome c oxidase subunit 3
MAYLQDDNTKLDLTPKKFNMWIFIFTSFMFFAALTSAFIVYVGGRGHALQIQMPNAFAYSTATIILSSVTMWLANKAAKGLQFTRQRLYLWISFALGIAFFIIQVFAWYHLTYRLQATFVNPNASISFIYVFSGMHMLHILAGLVLIMISLRKAYGKTPQVFNLYHMEMASIFWHFVDLVWIYLYVFLLLNQH